jgi:ribosomal protein S18 acetylase RimI-like enzyme
MTTVQPLRPADETVARALHAVLLQAHAQEARTLGLDARQWPPRSAAEISRSDDHFIGAFDGAELLGAIGIADDDEPGQLCIPLLVVRPQAQRRGVARGLVRAALACSPGLAVAVSVAALNTPALALYQALGFVPYRQGWLAPQGLAMLKLRRMPAPLGG